MPTMTKDGLFDLNSFDQKKQVARPQKKQPGGVEGFIRGVGSGLIAAPKHFIETDIVNPARETAAQLTGNKKALANARKQTNKELGLGEKGTDFTGGVKNFVGNTAQLGANFIPGGAAGIGSKIIQGAKAGAIAGGGEALANNENVATGAFEGALGGGAAGGVLGTVGKVAGKGSTKSSGILNKLADRGKALDAKSSGVEVGTSLKGGKFVTPEYETQLQDFMRNGSQKYVTGGVKAGAPRDQAFSAQEVFKGVKAKLGETLDNINRPLGEGDKLTLGTQVQNRIGDDTGIIGTTKTWDKFQTKLNKAKDLKDLEKLRQEADDLAFTSEKAGKTSAARQAHHVRDAIDEFITPESPEYKAIKGDYKLAKDALELTSKGAKNARGIKVPFAGVEVGSQATPAVKSKVGGFLSRFTSKGDEDVTPVTTVNAPELVGKLATGSEARSGQAASLEAQDVIAQQNRLQKEYIDRLIQDYANQTGTKVTGIPVKYVESVTSGKGIPETANKVLINPTIADLENVSNELASRGFSATSKVGKIASRRSMPKGGTSIFEPGDTSSFVKFQGNRTVVPLSSQSERTTILPAKPQAEGPTAPVPSYASEGIEPLPIPETAYAPENILAKVLRKPVEQPARSSFLDRLVGTSVIPVAAGAATANAPETTPNNDTATENVSGNSDQLNASSGDALGFSGSQDQLGFGGGSTQSNDPYAPENLQASVQSIIAQGGTQKDVAEYLSNAELMQKLTGGATKKPLNSTAAGVVADTQTGLQTLAALSDKIASSNANNPLIGKVRSLNPLDTNAQNLQASIATAKQIVGKALEGGVLRKEDEAKYAKILPTMNDTDAVAQHKIQELVNLISGRLQEYQNGISGGSGGTDLAELGVSGL